MVLVRLEKEEKEKNNFWDGLEFPIKNDNYLHTKTENKILVPLQLKLPNLPSKNYWKFLKKILNLNN